MVFHCSVELMLATIESAQYTVDVEVLKTGIEDMIVYTE